MRIAYGEKYSPYNSYTINIPIPTTSSKVVYATIAIYLFNSGNFDLVIDLTFIIVSAIIKIPITVIETK